MTAAADRQKILTKQHLEEAFKVLDVNGDNKIEASEIKACFAKGKMGEFKEKGVVLDDGYFDKIIKSIDINNDGYVTFAEFEIHMMKMVDKLTGIQPSDLPVTQM